jgi:AcrR family transcriptional regulator
MKAKQRILTPAPTGNGQDASRRERILEAAEQVFGDAGFAGASLRAIVRRARVNLATVYYYFGSKNGLMEAVLKRRFGPLRQQQLDLLRDMERKARGRPVPIESILKAMLIPPLTLAMGGPEGLGAVARLVGRIVTEPNEQTQAVIRSSNAEVREAFLKAFQESLPGVSLAQLQWRLEFVRGALALILCDPHKLEQDSRGARNPIDAEKVLAEMLVFFAPGFRAVGNKVPAKFHRS